MTDDLVIAAVPNWLLVRDRFGGPAEWRHSPGLQQLRPGQPLHLPAPPPARQPFRPITTGVVHDRP